MAAENGGGQVSDEGWRCVVLLLDRFKRIEPEEVRPIVEAVVGSEAAASAFGGHTDSSGSMMFMWRCPQGHQAFGSYDAPYPQELLDHQLSIGRGQSLLSAPELRRRWGAHTAWLYADGWRGDPDALESNVLRILSHFLDERCLLVHRRAPPPSELVIPSDSLAAAWREGKWPD
ncbi:MAG: hypothetical protein JJU33_05640 [Phycisphaerales bacterium]|nr:hypothetical protein [Phycisphaerales bacterium]